MTAPVYLDYFYGDEVKIDSFYRLPRVFLTNEFYSDISTEIKVLYSLMLDRVALSMRNGWREDDGRVFIYFTLNDAIRLLHVGKNKAVSLFQQMEKLDLIHRRKQGLGKPARVFLRTLAEAAPENADTSAPERVEAPPPSAVPPMATPEPEIMEDALPAETAPMPEPTRETIPTPVHDVKRPRDAGGSPGSRAERSCRTAERMRGRRPPSGGHSRPASYKRRRNSHECGQRRNRRRAGRSEGIDRKADMPELRPRPHVRGRQMEKRQPDSAGD